MLRDLKDQPADKILALMQAFRDDPRSDKIDLGVGVYRNAEGVTPVMRAVKRAEKRLWETQETKAYTGLAGDPDYAAALSALILGDAHPGSRLAAVATPGGTGAIRQGLELIRLAAPGARVWLSAPTWPNHPSILRYLGMEMAEYRYFDAATGEWRHLRERRPKRAWLSDLDYSEGAMRSKRAVGGGAGRRGQLLILCV